jgi:hypothetical protein
MRMKIVPAALGLALSTCPFGVKIPGGYARLEGTVRMANGAAYDGGIYIACGGRGWGRSTDRRGRYAVEYEIDGPVSTEVSAKGEYMVPCRVSAGGSRQPPFAVEYEMVPFSAERGRRATTRIDLLEGRMEPAPPGWQP